MNTEMIQQTLRETLFFSRLEPKDIEAIAQRMSGKSLEKGEILFYQEDFPADLHLLISGQLKSVRYTEEGKEILMHLIQPRELFSMVPAYLNISYTGTAIAVKKSSIATLPRVDLMELLSRSPEMALKMMGMMALRTKELLTRIEDQTACTPLQRLARFLVRESQRLNRIQFQLYLPKADLARLIGTTPETLSRSLQELSRQHLIEYQGSMITLLKSTELWEL